MESTYFVIDSVLKPWRNRIIQARIEGPCPDPQPHWWDCVPLDSSLPRITFGVGKNMPLFDNLFTGTIFELYSERLVRMLARAGIRFETFPARVVEASTRKKVRVNYRIFHLLEQYPALDKKLSDIDDESGDIRKLVINKKYLRLKKPLFRIEGAENIVLIHQELKDLLDSRDITGCNYIPVDLYQSSIDSYFNQFDDKE